MNWYPRPVLVAMLTLALGHLPLQAQVVPGCGDLRESTGPYDYRTAPMETRALVEKYHFTVRVEHLLGGQSGKIGADLDYTLRAFPNHHRALISMVRFEERIKMPHVPGARFPVECYFKRALQFAPDDTVARLLYARYLYRAKRGDEADRHVQYTIQEAGDNAFSHYNAGLVLAEHERYELALAQAHRAAALGFDRPELREMLVKAGQWREPPPAAAASAASAATANPASSAANPASAASGPTQ